MKEKKDYRTEATFIPANINDISLGFIINYCVSKGKEDVAWLKKLNESKVAPDKNGKERHISFIEIRKEFALKYFPRVAPVAKEKKVSMHDRIAAL